MIIDGRARDLGGFTVRRVLPAPRRRLVGPFIFFDHMGPATFAPGEGMDVRPHPHIGLATVTYLFEGEIIHRDSLGFEQAIRPGDINWMTAGRGIVHSERTHPDVRRSGARIHGVQLWVALPRADEEAEPSFHHHPGATIPALTHEGGASLRVLLGSAYGLTSPVRAFSPIFYVDAAMRAGVELPLPRDHVERAVYVSEGSVTVGEQRVQMGQMFVVDEAERAPLRAETDARVVLLGGASLDGDRHVFWNFVSSSKERIEQAKEHWREGKFEKVKGDELEFIPLPE